MASLQDGMDAAGGALNLLWKPDSPPLKVPVVPPEIVGWRAEQRAWGETVALMDQSFHMTQVFVEGADAVSLLAAISVNDYQNFVVGQAKQFLAVGEDGRFIGDAIICRLAQDRFNVVGVPSAISWVRYHAQNGGHDVSIEYEASGPAREGRDPILFRYEIQGPRARDLLAALLNEPAPEVRFFHFADIMIAGCKVMALRHGMAGQEGFELIGAWKDSSAVKQALRSSGAAFGLVEVGGMAYYTANLESGWIPTPLPAIYTDERLRDYREFINLQSYEAQAPLHGSFYSPNIEDFYVSPYELGYGRMVSFNHDFIGRAALEKAKDEVSRTKVSLVWNAEDVRNLFGGDHDALVSYSKDRVEADGKLIGMSMIAGFLDVWDTMVSLAVIDKAYAAPGTNVTVVWGEHPGGDANPHDHTGFRMLRATVQTAPLNDFARTGYRKNISDA